MHFVKLRYFADSDALVEALCEADVLADSLALVDALCDALVLRIHSRLLKRFVKRR